MLVTDPLLNILKDHKKTILNNNIYLESSTDRIIYDCNYLERSLIKNMSTNNSESNIKEYDNVELHVIEKRIRTFYLFNRFSKIIKNYFRRIKIRFNKASKINNSGALRENIEDKIREKENILEKILNTERKDNEVIQNKMDNNESKDATQTQNDPDNHIKLYSESTDFHCHEHENRSKISNECNSHHHVNCRYHQRAETNIYTRNWFYEVVQKRKDGNQIITEYKTNGETPNYCVNNNDNWCMVTKKYNNSCEFRKRLYDIKQSYVNTNNNNNNNVNNSRMTSKSVTGMYPNMGVHHFPNNVMGNQTCCRNSSSLSAFRSYNNSWKCGKKNNSNIVGQDNIENERMSDGSFKHADNDHLQHIHGNRKCCESKAYYDPYVYCFVPSHMCCEFCKNLESDPCCQPKSNHFNRSFSNPCCSSSTPCRGSSNRGSSNPCWQSNQNPTHHDNQAEYCCCGGIENYCRMCPQIVCPCFCESQNAFNKNQPKNMEYSHNTEHCEPPESTESCDSDDCRCPCPYRCSQFPKPPPYCLNTTYRMNYFQKCIPKFRRYRECDNIRLPLC